MANVLFGNGIADMRGSIGGTVFSKNRYGSYARNRTKPVNPNSSAQQAVRADLAYLVEQWSAALTTSQRNAWGVYAAAIVFLNKLGQSIKLTGFNHFIRSSVALLNNGLDYVAAGPIVLTLPGTDPDFVVSISEAAHQISVAFDDTANWCSEDDAYMSIHQGMPQPGTRNFFGGPSRRAGVILGNLAVPITSPQLINNTFVASEGQRDWITGRIGRADARLSEAFRDDTYVTA